MFIRKMLSIFPFFRPKSPNPGDVLEEIWIADFNKPKQVRFNIKSESSFDAKLRKIDSRHCLSLGLKKKGSIAWVEAPDYSYRDVLIRGRLYINRSGVYAAGGMMFRMQDEGTYYSFLISTKGYFRLDVLRNGMPLPLIGWTELPVGVAEISSEYGIDFSIIAYGTHIILLIRDRWVAEIRDTTIPEGSLSFTAVLYDGDDSFDAGPLDSVIYSNSIISSYKAEVFLESLIVDSRHNEVAAAYGKWSNETAIESENRFRLAETFTAMNQHNAALVQVRKAWDSPGYSRTQKELLLAGRLAQILGFYTEAESYISDCFQADVDSPEGREAITEMAKIFYASERFTDLKNYCTEAINLKPKDPILRNFMGHAHWHFEEYREAAAAYDKAFELDNKNGLLAKNAANVYEVMGKKKEALERLLAAGHSFLAAENYDDLGLLIPKLHLLGEMIPEARGLAAKWAFGIENWEMAEEELEKARDLEKKKLKDPALAYLKALLLIRKGERAEALPLLEEAVSLNQDYALFHFKYAESIFLLGDIENPKLMIELNAALNLEPNDGWINNLAAQLCLEKGDLKGASDYLRKASLALGDHPAIRMNKAILLSRQGSDHEALKLLITDKDDDEQGLLANCAGNILFEAGRFDEADEQYRKALSAEPENLEFMCNRASCLIKLGSLGEADTILLKAYEIEKSPGVLELLSYTASRMGEYDRAESACREALEMDPNHAPSLLSLGRVLISLGRIDEVNEVLERLKELELSETEIESREELANRLESHLYTVIPCSSCSRTWKVLISAPPVPGKRLFAMPPDHLPAGSCTACNKTWCIGCAKEHLDESGRFICSSCESPLKLANNGLKKIISDWAVEDGLIQEETQKEKAPVPRKQNRSRKNVK